MWTYTLPSDRSVEILNEAGYPLFTGALGCARTMRALADYRRLRERSCSRGEIAAGASPRARQSARAAGGVPGRVLSEWQARPLLAPMASAATTSARWRSPRTRRKRRRAQIGSAVALKVQSADIPHKTEAGAVALDVVRRDAARGL